jgi:hypothetical protein
MRDNSTLHTITYRPTTYRDESGFKHPSEKSGLKFKRWKVSAKLRDGDYVEGETHPDDEFVEGDNVTFTEWRKKGEDFNPNEFLIELVENFETLAKGDTSIGEHYRNLLYFASQYGNSMNDNLVEDSVVDIVARFGKMYKLPTLNILPFTKARDRYYFQLYMFYSTCKLIIGLFDIKCWYNVLGGDIEYFKSKNYKIVIDEES